jgi:hypothetical protein
MMRKSTFACLLIFTLFAAAKAQQFRGPQEFNGTVVGTAGSFRGRVYQFRLTLDRFTPDDETRRAAGILRALGPDALLDEIRNEKVGTFFLSGQVERNVNFAYARRMADGRLRIVAALERWMNPHEAHHQDYPFAYLEIFVDENGRGDGTLIPTAQIYFNKKDHNQVNVEKFGIHRARLVFVEWHTRPPRVAE